MKISVSAIGNKRAWVLPGIVATVIVVYFRGLFGGYAFDDFPNIVDNMQLHVSTLAWADWWGATFSSPSSELQRPLAMFTFALNYFFTGLDPFPIKLTNLMIHALNVVLAYWLAREIFSAWSRRGKGAASRLEIEYAPLALTALWALAPINLTPVLLSVQRMESLAQVFVFAGLSLYMSGRQRQRDGQPGWARIFVGIVVCTALGLLAKETAIAIPMYAFIIEWLLFGFDTRAGKHDLRLSYFYGVVLFLPLVAGCAKLLPWVLSPSSYANRSFTLSERLLTESRVLWSYVEWTLLPNLGELSLYHDDYAISRGLFQPVSTMIAIGGMIAAFIVAFAVRNTRPLMSLGILLFFAAHVLTATVIPLELVYEHRNYFASFGLLLIVVDGLMLTPSLRRFPWATIGAVAALVGFYSFTTFLRASEWGDPIRFALSEAAKHPLSPRAVYDEGRTYVALCNYDAESRFFTLARNTLIAASRIPDANMLPEQALLILAARTNTPQDDDWWITMQRKLSTRPVGVQEASALYTLSKCQEVGSCDFDQGKMLETFYAAMGTGNPRPEVLTIFANYAINVLHDYDLALRLIYGALEASQNNLQYHENLAKVLILLRKFDAAQGEIEQMKRLNHLGTSTSGIRAMEQRLQDAESLKPE